jgi:hypothetical protein
MDKLLPALRPIAWHSSARGRAGQNAVPAFSCRILAAPGIIPLAKVSSSETAILNTITDDFVPATGKLSRGVSLVEISCVGDAASRAAVVSVRLKPVAG